MESRRFPWRVVTVHTSNVSTQRKKPRPPRSTESVFGTRHRERPSREDKGYWVAQGTPTLDSNGGRAHRQVTASLGVKRLKPHATRHTFASEALAAGLDPAWISRRLAHHSVALLSTPRRISSQNDGIFRPCTSRAEHTLAVSCIGPCRCAYFVTNGQTRSQTKLNDLLW